MTPEERSYICELLNQNPDATEEEIERAAEALIRRRALEEVRDAVRFLGNQRGVAEVMRQYAYYPFASPVQPDNVLRETKDSKLIQPGVRQCYRVRLIDLEDFCREHRLDVRAMRELGEGQRKEHKGWVRYDDANPYARGQQPEKPYTLPFGEDGEPKQRVYVQPAVMQPPQQYTPR